MFEITHYVQLGEKRNESMTIPKQNTCNKELFDSHYHDSLLNLICKGMK